MSGYNLQNDLLGELSKYNKFNKDIVQAHLNEMDKASGSSKLALLAEYNKLINIKKEKAIVIDKLTNIVKISQKIEKGDVVSNEDKEYVHKFLINIEKKYEALLIELYNKYLYDKEKLGELGDIKCPTSTEECVEILKRIYNDEFVRKHQNTSIRGLSETLAGFFRTQGGGHLNKYDITPQNYKNMTFW